MRTSLLVFLLLLLTAAAGCSDGQTAVEEYNAVTALHSGLCQRTNALAKQSTVLEFEDRATLSQVVADLADIRAEMMQLRTLTKDGTECRPQLAAIRGRLAGLQARLDTVD